MFDPIPQNVPISPVDQFGGIQTPPQQMQQQVPPELQHMNDVYNQYTQQKQQNQPPSMLQSILQNRMQPEMQDVAQAGYNTAQSYLRPDLYKPMSPDQALASRYQNELSPYTSLLENQMKQGTQYMNMSGGGTGVLTNRMMQDNPGMTFTEALNHVQADPRLLGMGLQLQPGMGNQPSISTIPGAPQALGQVKYGENLGGTTGTKQAELGYAGPIAAATTGAQEQQKLTYAQPISQATKSGENAADNQQVAMGARDVSNLYKTLLGEAPGTPSGALQSTIARTSNYLNAPTQGAINQGAFDADLNNLYLATIRTLKGTGRIMEQEIENIKQAQPKDNDSNPVKIAKMQAHLQYYQGRMRELGFDPDTGQPVNGQQIPQMNAGQLNQMPAGGNPVPPTPAQLNQQSGASHSYDPATGRLVPLQ